MIRIVERIKEKNKIKKYNEERQAYLKKHICNIGNIVEEKDKIICYVDQKSIDRYKGNKSIYKMRLNGMNQVTEGIKETVEKLQLNKPVYYIFDGIEFDADLVLSSLWANIIFRNCKFDKNVGIIYGDEITFENNKYLDHCPYYFYGTCFLTADRISRITFVNDNFSNSDVGHHPTKFGMKIDAKLVEFINTNVNAEHPGTINIKAERTRIENSEIKSNEIYFDSQNIDFTDSSIIAQNGVIIENANCDFVGNVQAPIIYYNGTDLADNTQETHNVNKYEATLKETRKNLIDKLKSLSNYCNQLNDNKLQAIKDKLNSQTIVKTLKQKQL
ncbi:MAG: hypothetical protein IJB83_04920 [Bacilli bacterium]|nr:hypothetical protein [Bacilli bacterium]